MQQGQYYYSAGNSSDSALFNASMSVVGNTNSKEQESNHVFIGDRQAKARSINDKYCNQPATVPMVSMPRTFVKYNGRDISIFNKNANDKLVRMMAEDDFAPHPYSDEDDYDSSSTDLEDEEKLLAVPDTDVLKSILANVQNKLPVSSVVEEVGNSAQFGINLPLTALHTKEHSASNVSASTDIDALLKTLAPLTNNTPFQQVAENASITPKPTSSDDVSAMDTSQNDALMSEDVSRRQNIPSLQKDLAISMSKVQALANKVPVTGIPRKESIIKFKMVNPSKNIPSQSKEVASHSPKHASPDIVPVTNILHEETKATDAVSSVCDSNILKNTIPLKNNIPTLVSSNSGSVDPNQAKTSHLQSLAQQAILKMRKSSESNITKSTASAPLTSERFSPIPVCEPSMPHSLQKQVYPVAETQFYPSLTEASVASSLTSFLQDVRNSVTDNKRKNRKCSPTTYDRTRQFNVDSESEDDDLEKKKRKTHKERSRKKHKVRSPCSPSDRKKHRKHSSKHSKLRTLTSGRRHSPHRSDYRHDNSPHRQRSSPNNILYTGFVDHDRPLQHHDYSSCEHSDDSYEEELRLTKLKISNDSKKPDSSSQEKITHKKSQRTKKFDSPQEESGDDEDTPSSSQNITVKIKQEKIDEYKTEEEEKKQIIKKEIYVDNEQIFAGLSQYYCKICQLQLNSEVPFKTHMNGKRHAKAIKAKQVPEVARDCFTKAIKAQSTWQFPVPAEGYRFVEKTDRPQVEPAFTRDDIIPGLKDVTEIRLIRNNTIYFCRLCNSQCSPASILPHLTGCNHITNSLRDRDRKYHDCIKDCPRKEYLRKAKMHVSRWARETMKVMDEVLISPQSSSDGYDSQPGPSWRDTKPPSNVSEEEKVGECEEIKCLDTSKGNFRCKTCDASMGDYSMYKNHIRGKRHLKNTKKMPGESISKAKSVEDPTIPSILQRELNKAFYDDVIVGLDYVRETHNINGAIFNCFLCGACNALDQAIEHLFTYKHRLKYLEKTSDKEYNSFALIRNMQLTEYAKEPIVIEQCRKMEQIYGSGIVNVYRVK